MYDYVTLKQQDRIIKWNIDRGLTELNCDLEIRLLTEERREFWLAQTFEHKLQEFCDFLFVSSGTMFKINAHSVATMPLAQSIQENIELLISSTTRYYSMIDLLKFYLAEDIKKKKHSYALLRKYNDLTDALKILVKETLDIIINTNNKKPKTKDSKGKIIKGDDHIDPLIKIKEMLYGSEDS